MLSNDGAYGVQVINEVIMKDPLESHGAREISTLEKIGSLVDKKVFFAVVGDVSKARSSPGKFGMQNKGRILGCVVESYRCPRGGPGGRAGEWEAILLRLQSACWESMSCPVDSIDLRGV